MTVSSCSAARNAALSVRASRMTVSRALASGWSTVSTSMKRHASRCPAAACTTGRMVDPEVSATLYRESRGRITGVAGGLDGAALGAVVPACPQWTVWHLLAHLTGVAADVVNGNLAGAPGPQWSAAHIAA